jgi:transposase
MPNPKPPYPPEFRAEAVRLARQPGHSVRGLAKDLGISNETLRLWIRQTAVDHGEAPGLSTDERAELVRLRRENRTLRIEREILKKAAAFFARETEPTP